MSAATGVTLSLHGGALELRARDGLGERALAEMRRDFSAFASSSSSARKFETRIELGRQADPVGAWLPVFATRSYQVFGLGRARAVRYGWGFEAHARVESENAGSSRRFRVAAGELADLHEQGYLAALSAVGEALDLRGLHRAHALGFEGGFEGERSGVLVLLPSGGGKSALASLLLEKSAARIHSDETPLLDREGRLHPFPVRIALAPGLAASLGVFRSQGEGRPFKRRQYREKRLFEIPAARVAPVLPIRTIVVGRPGGRAVLREGSRLEALGELGRSLVVGAGVAQMAEHLLRAEGLPGLAAIAASRARASVACVSQARCLRLDYTRDAFENFEAIKPLFAPA